MRIQIRKSVSGTEYRDTEEKRSIFVPNGQEPDFEVSENPSIIQTSEETKEIIAVDHSNGNDKTVTTEIMKKEDGGLVVAAVDVSDDFPPEESEDLEGMTIKQLREYAKKNKITIPAAIKTRGDIINILSNAK